MHWTELARAELPNGDVLTLRRRGDDFEIRVNLLELMSSRNPVSERAMARLACADRKDGRILVGGLGLGYTVRAVLDAVGPKARVTVAELVPAVVAWNRGPLADVAARPLDDRRVTLFEGDVADAIRARPGMFDAILMDVDNGPDAVCFPENHALYTADGIKLLLSGLARGGALCLWAAGRSPDFEHVLKESQVRFDRIDVEVAATIAHTLYEIFPL